jgi:arylformamidase
MNAVPLIRDSPWIDISIPIRPGMLQWPGDPAFQIERTLDQEKGDACTLSHMNLCAHTGTHMDAPLHFIRNAAPIDQMPLDATVGPARVIPIGNATSIQADELRRHEISPGERILLKTANSDRRWQDNAFDENFVFISRDGAAYLAGCRIRSIGIDYLSVDGFHRDAAHAHLELLGAGIWIIEGLNLSHVDPGPCELMCLPLRLMGADGAPARAILRSLQ